MAEEEQLGSARDTAQRAIEGALEGMGSSAYDHEEYLRTFESLKSIGEGHLTAQLDTGEQAAERRQLRDALSERFGVQLAV